MADVVAGRFQLLDVLASGGMGEVWRARDLRTNEVVAVKVLMQSNASGLMRFMREQGMRIHHPHVLTPLGWAGADGRVLFSMPLVDGGSVATLVGDYGPLPTRYAAELLRQLLDGVAAVHAAGIIHRDVKPQNLLLDATGFDRPRLRLSDFGVALPEDGVRLTTRATVVGTPSYLAPELRLGAEPSPAQDVYAVGMVGRELLTGVRHVPGDPEPDRPPQADPELWRLLDLLIQEDPALRPSVVEARRALDDPRHAWVEQRDIEVFNQLPDPPTDLEPTRRVLRPTASAPTPFPQTPFPETPFPQTPPPDATALPVAQPFTNAPAASVAALPAAGPAASGRRTAVAVTLIAGGLAIMVAVVAIAVLG